MFFKQIRRNAARNRRGNGLYFGSLIIAIVAFYTLLSLENQDVMRFLATIESDAVRKLMLLIPSVYVVSLFFVFFLVYFACKYQTDSRQREFGMYLMLGMKRSRLFFMLLGETLWSSVISLLIGIPVALFLTEAISLLTARLVGLGIIVHKFTFSPDAVLLTMLGFIIVQLLSMLIICIPYGKAEPMKFLKRDASPKHTPMSAVKSGIFLFFGAAFLLAAYYIGLFGLDFEMLWKMAVSFISMLVFGVLGTFLLFRGLGGFIGRRIAAKSRDAAGLSVFTGRQLEESVLSEYKALAISSLLLLIAISCISFGIAVGSSRMSDSRSAELSLFGSEEEIDAAISSSSLIDMTASSYPVYLSSTKSEIDVSEIKRELEKIDGAENAALYIEINYIISLSSYNDLMRAMGRKEIILAEGEAALYSSLDSDTLYSYFARALESEPSIDIDGVSYKLLPELFTNNIVADRAITLYAALIVPESLYDALAYDMEPFCRNVHLKEDIIDELGLMQAIQGAEALLSKTGIDYESYLGGIGRNLFYMVAASYITVYLGILFLLIANTVIGTKFLMLQRASMHRYRTLLMLGADTEEMCRSVKKQIEMFFMLSFGVALCSGVVAVMVLFSSFTKLPDGASLAALAVVSAFALLAVVAIELIYVNIVKRNARREIRAIEITDRG